MHTQNQTLNLKIPSSSPLFSTLRNSNKIIIRIFCSNLKGDNELNTLRLLKLKRQNKIIHIRTTHILKFLKSSFNVYNSLKM